MAGYEFTVLLTGGFYKTQEPLKFEIEQVQDLQRFRWGGKNIYAGKRIFEDLP